ncbi:hypothetical protein [Pseudomonas sp. M30-35]|uniref:hypothetical protein n=1 Tax=Pseudomonas sp. M30-35 TaxID=1981174 RepID=UPI000B3C6358|nr:hypothetical protein [Pseudomonas sp. M30-35]ARU87804.1 hypothetical protein B9K09_07425 [Pseudomonas sp. M30-35]
MSKKQGKVVALCAHDSDAALERLNRVTGLRFARWPESLAPQVQPRAEEPKKVVAEVVGVIESISA